MLFLFSFSALSLCAFVLRGSEHFLEKFGLTLVQLGAEKSFRKVWLISFSVVQIYNTENLRNLGILMLDFCLSCLNLGTKLGVT